MLVLLLAFGVGPVCAQTPEADAWVVEAFAALDANRPKQALALFERALGQTPESAELLTYVGLGYFKVGNPRAALHALESAKRRDASLVDPSFLFYRANCLRSIGLTTSERNAWQELKTWDPNSRFAELATEALAENRPDQTVSIEEWIGLGLSMLPDHACAATIVFEEAQLKANDAEQATILPYLALALNECGQHRDVVILASEHPDQTNLGDLWHLQLGVAYVEQGMWDQAQTVLHKVSSTSPLYEQSQLLNAICLAHQGQTSASSDALTTLLEQGDTTLSNELNDLQQAVQGLAPVRENTQ